MIDFSITHGLIIFLVGFIGNFIGSTAGGGALVALPTCIFLGFSPQVAIATTRLGAISSTITGWYAFHKKGKINYRMGFISAFIAAIGSLLGAFIMIGISSQIFRWIIASLMVLVLIITIIKKRGLKEHKIKELSHVRRFVGYSSLFALGVFGGVFGAGQGVILNYILVLIFGQTFLEAAGTRKIITFFVSLIPIIIFQAHHLINWLYAFVFIISGALGSYFGSLYGIKKGDQWVQKVFMIVVVLMAFKLIF